MGDQETGMTFRWGKTFDDDPTFAPVPELADISISNHCTKGCTFCYRDSRRNNIFMSLEDYDFVLSQLNHPEYGNTFQVALGGGEPLEHPQFLEMIDITRKHNVVPNFTTNGRYLTNEVAQQIKGKVGGVAVSIVNFDFFEVANTDILVSNGVKTNIHFVMNKNNLKQAIQILEGKYNAKLDGINAIIFLTFKPCGRGKSDLVMYYNKEMQHFLKLIDDNKCAANIGFDACFVPPLMFYTMTRQRFIDTCEVGFFSVYIDENLRVMPCSFSDGRDAYSLRDYTFYDIWLNKFAKFRNGIKNECQQTCSSKSVCRGTCHYYPEITMCYKN